MFREASVFVPEFIVLRWLRWSNGFVGVVEPDQSIVFYGLESCWRSGVVEPFFMALTARLLQPFFMALTARLLEPGSYSLFSWLLQPVLLQLVRLLQPDFKALTARLLQPLKLLTHRA